jgi:hypothetical protein
MPILYKKQRPTRTSLPANWRSDPNDLNKNLADELEPTSSLIDVVADFPWTLTPTTSRARNSAPYIYLNEFYQLDTQLNQSLKPYGTSIGSVPSFSGNILSPSTILTFFNDLVSFTGSLGGIFSTQLATIAGSNNDLYEGLFDHNNPTKFKYRLPFFTQEYFSITNNWKGVNVLDQIINLQATAIQKIGAGIGAEIFGKLSQLPENIRKIEMFNIMSNNPMVGLIDPPKVWSSSPERNYTFQFPLYNINATDKTNSTDTVIKNWELCFALTYQNLINKRNFFTGVPPVFYEVIIPGVHYSKASYMSDISISNIGNIRKMKLSINGNTNADVNVPDAYLISITLTDLLMPSKNLLANINGGPGASPSSRVSASSTGGGTGNTGANAIEPFPDLIYNTPFGLYNDPVREEITSPFQKPKPWFLNPPDLTIVRPQ